MFCAQGSKDIFSLLDLECTDRAQHEVAQLFGGKKGRDGDPSSSLSRVKLVHRLYVRWMNRRKETKNGSSFYDAINNGLATGYDFSRFLSDFRAVTANKELLVREEELNAKGGGDDDTDCEAAH